MGIHYAYRTFTREKLLRVYTQIHQHRWCYHDNWRKKQEVQIRFSEDHHYFWRIARLLLVFLTILSTRAFSRPLNIRINYLRNSGEKTLVNVTVDRYPFTLVDTDGVATLSILQYILLQDKSMQLYREEDEGRKTWNESIKNEKVKGWQQIVPVFFDSIALAEKALINHAKKASTDEKKQKLGSLLVKLKQLNKEFMDFKNNSRSPTYGDLNKIGSFLADWVKEIHNDHYEINIEGELANLLRNEPEEDYYDRNGRREWGLRTWRNRFREDLLGGGTGVASRQPFLQLPTEDISRSTSRIQADLDGIVRNYRNSAESRPKSGSSEKTDPRGHK